MYCVSPAFMGCKYICPKFLSCLSIEFLNPDKQIMVLNILFHNCKVVSICLTRVSHHITVPDGRGLNKCAVIPWLSFELKSSKKSPRLSSHTEPRQGQVFKVTTGMCINVTVKRKTFAISNFSARPSEEQVLYTSVPCSALC